MRHYLTLLLALLASPTLHAQESLMFDKMKTYCFGRYLVDIPVGAELKGQGNTYLSTTIKMGKGIAEFKKLIDDTISKRKSETWKRGYKYIRSELENDPNNRLILSRADLFGDVAYGIDTFKLIPNTQAGSGNYFYTMDSAYDDKIIDSIVSDYKKMLASLRYRGEKEAPIEPGFCFANGFVANDGKTPQLEQANLYLTLKKHPNVAIRVSSYVNFKKQKGLIERGKDSAKKLPFVFMSKVKIIREGLRDINGVQGEEHLETFPSDDQTGIAHMYAWEASGELGNPIRPGLHLRISTGEYGAGQTAPSSLSSQEVMALYEAIVKTIRLRPTGDDAKPKTPANQPKPSSQLPLGTRVASGLPCPQSGLWRCERADAQEPERHFLAGQTVPAVMVPAKRSLWQTLTGAPASVAEDTYWKLVQHHSDS